MNWEMGKEEEHNTDEKEKKCAMNEGGKREKVKGK